MGQPDPFHQILDIEVLDQGSDVFWVLWHLEGHPFAHEEVHDDPAAPNIALDPIVSLKHLWGHINRLGLVSTTYCANMAFEPLCAFDTRPKVYKLHNGFLLGHKQDVLGLDIPMRDIQPMAIAEGRQNLVHGPGKILLGGLLRIPRIEQLTALQVLHNDIEAVIVLKVLEYLQNVGVVQLNQDVGFVLNPGK